MQLDLNSASTSPAPKLPSSCDIRVHATCRQHKHVDVLTDWCRLFMFRFRLQDGGPNVAVYETGRPYISNDASGDRNDPCQAER